MAGLMWLIILAGFIVVTPILWRWRTRRARQPVLVVAAAQKRRPRRRHKDNADGAISLGELLSDLTSTFNALTRRSNGASWTDKSTRLGLKALGPFIPYRGPYKSEVDERRVKVRKGMAWSSLIFVHIPGCENMHNSKKTMYPDFLYAQRIKSMPWQVERIAGIHYECGGAYRITKKSLLWVNFYITVNPETGDVTACHELRDEEVWVPGTARRGPRVYTRKKWTISPVADPEWGKNDEERNSNLAAIFVIAFDFWSQTDSMWKVSVRKDGRRATFCVPDNDAKYYFKDRDKTALTPQGKRRPIIHFVQEHERQLSDGIRTTTVKEHLRGLRRFDWHGHQCAVIAPKFHIAAESFDVPAEDADEFVLDGRPHIDITELGRRLASLEDEQRLH